MKHDSRALRGLIVMMCMSIQLAQAQNCALPSKEQVSNAMNIDQALRPLLNLEIPNCRNIVLGEGYAGFVLNEDNVKIHNGVRSEIAIGYPFVEGDTVEYRWSIMVPALASPGGNAQQWWLIAQWHDQPDPRLGETWATFKSQSPPVAVYIEKRNGIVGIGLHGWMGTKLSWAPVATDTWLDITTTIRWSTTSNGTVRFSVANQPELEFASMGRNMLNSYQHYFKAGQYRAPTINSYAVIYIKNVYFRKL